MSEFEILPVFPSVISATKLENHHENFWDDVKNLDFFRSTADDTHLVYSSKDMKILESYINLKHNVLDFFYEFKNEILKLESTDFDVTTSWVTKTETGGFCQYHCHKNSYYSGVLYNDKTDRLDSGNLLFTDAGIKEESILVNQPSDWNILNSKRIVVEPDKNLLIFFPSFLRHRISKYTGLTPRYSLAFNIFPIGKIGDGDSYIDLNLLKK